METTLNTNSIQIELEKTKNDFEQLHKNYEYILSKYNILLKNKSDYVIEKREEIKNLQEINKKLSEELQQYKNQNIQINDDRINKIETEEIIDYESLIFDINKIYFKNLCENTHPSAINLINKEYQKNFNKILIQKK